MTVQETVLQAFQSKPRSCIHQLMEATGATRADLRYALVELQKVKLIRKISDVKGDYVYELIQEQPHKMSVAENVGSLKYDFGVDEETAKKRVVMLRRMKSNLICEWHPVLDILLGDYMRGVEAVDAARRKLENAEDGEFVHIVGEKT